MKTRMGLIFVFLGLLVLGVTAACFFQFHLKYGAIAQVSVDGEVVLTVDLNAVTAPYTLAAGEGNTVLIEPGAISMESATCPDQLCVNQGKITGGVYPIVCLPNRVTVKIVSDRAGDPDVIAGGVAS